MGGGTGVSNILKEIGIIVGEASSSEFYFSSKPEEMPSRWEYVVVFSLEDIGGVLREVPVIAQVQGIVSVSQALTRDLDFDITKKIVEAGIADRKVWCKARILGYLTENSELIWLDIGSGGGFPTIPILLAFKEIRTILIERKIRKTGFLQLLIKKFNLVNTKVICDTFPDCIPKFEIKQDDIGIITARGVEKPERLAKFLSHWLSEKTIFLCQSPKIDTFFPPDKFSIHIAEDNWSKVTPPLRKGKLILIRKLA
mgnify:CR=1 FL=1